MDPMKRIWGVRKNGRTVGREVVIAVVAKPAPGAAGRASVLRAAVAAVSMLDQSASTT